MCGLAGIVCIFGPQKVVGYRMATESNAALNKFFRSLDDPNALALAMDRIKDERDGPPGSYVSFFGDATKLNVDSCLKEI